MDLLAAVRSLDDLRRYIHATLCSRENILSEQFGLSESPLMRNGQPCGRQFAVQGPRSIRLQAIWDEVLNVVYFYDARGNRFQKVQLPERLLESGN